MFISNYQFETSLPDASQCAFQENEIYNFKDTLGEILSSNKTQVFTKYDCEHLGSWYIKSINYKSFYTEIKFF